MLEANRYTPGSALQISLYQRRRSDRSGRQQQAVGDSGSRSFDSKSAQPCGSAFNLAPGHLGAVLASGVTHRRPGASVRQAFPNGGRQMKSTGLLFAAALSAGLSFAAVSGALAQDSVPQDDNLNATLWREN